MSCIIHQNGSVTCCAPGGPCTTSGGPATYPTCAGTIGQCPCSYDGCMDPAMSNYDQNATCDDGSCVAWITGCMDPNSYNYNPSATQDDGGCIPHTTGCSDPNAYNYNSAATLDCSGQVIPPPMPSFSGGYSNFNQKGFGGYNDKMWFND